MRSSWWFVVFSLLAACSDSSDDRWVTRPEPGVRREVFVVRGTHPAPNPSCTANCETPAERDYTQVLRYREDTNRPAPVSAILLAMPGFLAGGGTFDVLAKTLVRRGIERGTRVEVWAIDRRANLLEDTFGLEEAERREDPELAASYYRDFTEVGGRVFGDFVASSEVAYMSEWGLATHVEDVRRVVGLVPAELRKNHVFLMGHSLGGSFVEAYAGWEFEGDGARGVDELAGLIVIDGILASTPSTEDEYVNGTDAAGFPTPGLDGIRTNLPYTALPVLGVSALVNAEIVALRARFDPEGVVEDDVRDWQFALLFAYSGSGSVPSMSNLAALGLAFDGAHQPLPFVRATIGTIAGPTESFTSLFNPEPLVRPSDTSLTYGWTDGPASPSEYASATDLAASMVDGESNLAEWYFPSRLALDLAAVGGGTIAPTDYPASYGLRVFAGDRIDAPILCIAAELVGDVGECDAIRARVAPAIGPGRPLEGSTRGSVGEDVGAFRILDVTTMAHIDPLLARDHAFNPVPAKIEEMIDTHAGAGTVTIAIQPFPAAR